MRLVNCRPQGRWRHHDKVMAPTAPNKMLLGRCSTVGTNDCKVSNYLMIFQTLTHYAIRCPLSGPGIAQSVQVVGYVLGNR